jgi:hypothetical protein
VCYFFLATGWIAIWLGVCSSQVCWFEWLLEWAMLNRGVVDTLPAPQSFGEYVLVLWTKTLIPAFFKNKRFYDMGARGAKNC